MRISLAGEIGVVLFFHPNARYFFHQQRSIIYHQPPWSPLMHTLLLALESPVIEALGWTLVHFVWQATLLAALLAVLLRAVGRIPRRG